MEILCWRMLYFSVKTVVLCRHQAVPQIHIVHSNYQPDETTGWPHRIAPFRMRGSDWEHQLRRQSGARATVCPGPPPVQQRATFLAERQRDTDADQGERALSATERLGRNDWRDIRSPKDTEQGKWWSLSDISDYLATRYTSFDKDTPFQKIGNALNDIQFNFKSKRTTQHMEYWFIEK